MTDLTQDDTTTIGNTKINSRARKWVFTINNPRDTDDTLLRLLLSKSKYVYQREQGEEGTQHIQGYCEFINARSFKSMKEILPRAHIEKCRDSDASILYCQKEETRIAGPWGPLVIQKIKDPLKDKELKQWQQDIINLLYEEPDERTIHWYYDSNGGAGKTSLAKHLCIKYPNQILYCGGKSTDIKYAISKFIEEGNYPNMCIFDYTRSMEAYVSYEALETIKNGIFFNNKYESKMILYNSPHVVVFSNFKPELERLSLDRWNIIDI